MTGQFDEQTLRLYLLGQLTDDSQQALEKSLLTDDQLFEELLVAEDELIDEYLGGKLSDGEREGFEKHFLSTTQRHQKLRFGRTFKKYVLTHAAAEPVGKLKPSRSQWSWTQAFFSSPLRIAACAIVVLAVAIGVWRVFFHQSDVDKGLLALNAAYREQRPLEARISALSYAPFSQTRGGGPERVDSLARNKAELSLTNAVSEHPNAAAHHALGEVYLAKKQFDEAVKEFEQALKTDQRNPQLLSDLGAALLEKSKIDRNGPDPGQGLEELARSLEDLNRALDLNNNLLEALFNRALCHQYLMLPRQAENDWREYLKKDSTSQWADEARHNLKLLGEQNTKMSQTKEQLLQGFLSAQEAGDSEKAWQIVSVSRDDLSGTSISRQLLDGCLESTTNGREEGARRNLRALAYLGDLERKRAGEYYNTNLAGLYRDLTRPRRVLLIRAHILMESGYEHYRSSTFPEAIEAFGKAEQAFDEVGDHEEASLAQYWIAYSHREASETEMGLLMFKRLAQDCERRHYKWLLTRTLYSISGAQFSLNEYSLAIDYCTRALALAEQIGDAVSAFSALDVLIEIYRSLNNYPLCTKFIERSLYLIDCCPFNPVKVWGHYAIIASAFNSAGFYRAAIDYQKEALLRAMAVGETLMVCVSYAHLGMMYGKLGNYGEGLRNVKLAYEKAAERSNEAPGKEMMAYSSLQMAHLYREERECDRAIESYNRSVSLYESLQLPVLLYQAHKGLLVCYLAGASDQLASNEIRTTLELTEKYRSTILEVDNRNSFFNNEQSVYDLAVDFAYSRLHNSQLAFDYMESSRARSLVDQIHAAPRIPHEQRELPAKAMPISQPLPLSEIRRRIPAEAQLVEYAVLENKLVVWIVNRQDSNVRECGVTKAALEQKVRVYLDSISSPSESDITPTKALAKELYDLLIKPIEPLLDRNKQLDFVPDKILNLVPFGALISAESNRYLIEDYSLAYAPSATVFVLASEHASQKADRRTERLLSVGNPTFDPKAFPSLADLPAAAEEAEEITAYYTRSTALVGRFALKQTVERAMLDSDVVHLALHAVPDEAFGLRSKLVLARNQEAPDEENLQAYEIYNMRLPRTRLVVLSACKTGSGRYYSGEGSLNLARPFLAAGVPVVVASLWPVDSEATRELMINFHKHRKEDHLTSADALKRAQLDMLVRSDLRFSRPYFWASFFALGGYTTF